MTRNCEQCGHQHASLRWGGVCIGCACEWRPPAGLCEKCEKRPATENWSEGVIAAVHGMAARWCSLCVVEEQIAHGERMVLMLPSLKQRRDELLAADAVPASPSISK